MEEKGFSYHFWLTDSEPSVEGMQSLLRSSKSGAEVVFTGVTRVQNKGKQVVRLEFEAYAAMAEAEAARMLQEAGVRWPLHKAVMVHTTGHCPPGTIAVVVGVSAAHRRESFEACQWLMDELKSRLPVWKKEVYSDGAEWVSPTP
jgi:molybdopterin synthase catalytic subunit